MSISVALCWGLLAGSVVFRAAGRYYYRFWRGRATCATRAIFWITRNVGVTLPSIEIGIRRSASNVQNAFLGRDVPVTTQLSGECANGAAQASETSVIEGYRINSDPRIQGFDWPKVEVCFTHLIEMDRNDRDAQGKLALCHG